MSWSITIGGVELVDSAHDTSRLLRRGSVNIARTLNGRTSCGFVVISPDGSYTPAPGAPVSVSYSNNLIYGGFVWSLTERTQQGSALKYFDVTCVDNNYIADHRVSGDRIWTDAYAGVIAADICNTDLLGEDIETTFITQGPLIDGEYKITGYPTVTEALNALAAKAKCYWYIDPIRAMRFFSSATAGFTAPFDATTGNTHECSTLHSLEEYANMVVLKLPQLVRPLDTELFNGDGSATSFSLAYPVASQPRVWVNTVTLGIVEQSVGQYGVDEGKQWYWASGSNAITQDRAASPLTSGDVLSVKYAGLEQITISRSADGTNGTSDEITARAAVEGGSGLHVRVFEHGEQATSGQAGERAASILDAVDEIPSVRSYRTNSLLEPSIDLLKPGDKQTILGVEYVIRSLKWQDEVGSDLLWLEAEGVRGPLLQDFAELLASLASPPSAPSAAPVTNADPLPETDVPGAPSFGVSTGGRGTFEFGAIGFDTLDNTATITSGTLRLYYWDELSSPSMLRLATAAGASDTVLYLPAAAAIAVADLLQLGRELVRVLEISTDGIELTVERGVHDTTPEATSTSVPVYPLQRYTTVFQFPPAFFGTPEGASWLQQIPLAGARIAAAEFYVTNGLGDSPTTPESLTSNLSSGLRTNFGGQYIIQFEGALAVTNSIASPLRTETQRAIWDVQASVTQAPLVQPVVVALRVNGAFYAELTIAAGATWSNIVSGFGLPPLPAQAALTVSILSVPTAEGSDPGRDLTVTIRL